MNGASHRFARSLLLAASLVLTTALAQQQPPAASLRRIDPAAVTAGSPAFRLTVAGTAFKPTTRVLWAGVPLPTQWESENLLIAEVPPARAASAGKVDVSVSLEKGATAPLSFTINPALTWVTAEKLQPAGASGFYTHALTLTGGTPPIRFALAAGARLPAGLHLDGHNGILVGYPSQPGSYTLPIEAADSGGGRARRDFVLEIAGRLALLAEPLPHAFRGRPYSAQLKTHSASPSAADWKTIAGALPPGLTLAPSTGSITGTPAADGAFEFVAQARGPFGSAAQSYTIVVRPPVRAALPPSAITSLAGNPIRLPLNAESGQEPYEWSLANGLLPPGLSLEGPVISGVPTTAGSYRLQLRVRDATGGEASGELEISIRARLSIAASPPPSAGLGVAYTHQFSATGGVPPYVWSLSGALGDGLILDANSGRLTGAPLSPGERRFTVRVADREGNVAAQDFTFTVSPPPDPELILQLPDRASPGEQMCLPVRLKQPHPVEVAAIVTVRLESQAGVDDPSVQFSTGGRVARLVFRPGATQPETAAALALQTGSVAGTLILLCRIESAAAPEQHQAALLRIPVDATPPQIRSVRMNRTAAGLEIVILGTSPTRDLRSARFSFDGAGELDVPLESLSSSWFGDVRSIPHGGLFTYRQPFTVQGDVGRLRGVSVVLRNSVGGSVPVSAAATLP